MGNVAFQMEFLEVRGAFTLKNLVAMNGKIALTSAKLTALVDSPQSWLIADNVYLDGLVYTRIHGPTDAKTRLAWLAKADQGKDKFYPQPYKQLAKVLHDMGHEHDAREVSYVLAEKLETERLRRIREDRQEAIRGAAQPGKAIGLSLYLGSLRIWKSCSGCWSAMAGAPFAASPRSSC